MSSEPKSKQQKKQPLRASRSKEPVTNIAGLRLRALREIYGFSLDEVASSLAIDPTTLSRYECHTLTNRMGRVPPADKLREFASLYGVSIDLLLGFAEHDKELESLASLLPIEEARQRLGLPPKEDKV
jgi:transcriptional regulator with XRE-family HTH domain